MFAYCGNNPTVFCDPTGHLRLDVVTCSVADADWGRRHAASMDPIYYKADGLIQGQAEFEFSQAAFGLGSYAHNGCGAIAIYNALQLLGYDVSLGMIHDQIKNKNGFCMGGLFGMNALVIDDILTERGVACTGYLSSATLMQNVQEGTVVIIYAMNDVATVFRGLHYVTAQYNDGQFMLYNVYSNSTQPEPANSICQPYENSCYLYGFVVGG